MNTSELINNFNTHLSNFNQHSKALDTVVENQNLIALTLEKIVKNAANGSQVQSIETKTPIKSPT